LVPRLQDFERIESKALEYHGQLVHQRDVEIALCVFDHFGRLRHPYRRRAVNAGADHGTV
jgi:hypothetical protein